MEYNILLVDDEETIHELLPIFLARNKKHTFTVRCAINGKAGVEMYSKLRRDGHKPDLVLMDIRMPVMDGVEATRRIMENDPKANIYLFTAYAKTQIERDALKAGAKGTLNKVADWHRTVESIINILEQKSAGQRPEVESFGGLNEGGIAKNSRLRVAPAPVLYPVVPFSLLPWDRDMEEYEKKKCLTLTRTKTDYRHRLTQIGTNRMKRAMPLKIAQIASPTKEKIRVLNKRKLYFICNISNLFILHLQL